MPSAPILRGAGPSGSHQQPGWPSRRRSDHAERRAGLRPSPPRALERAGRSRRPRSRQPDDRVGDELARAVVRDLAAALDPDDLDAAACELVGTGEDVAVLGVAAEGQDRGMLEEQQPIADQAVGASRGELLLERPRLAIRDPPEPRCRERFKPVADALTGRGHAVGFHARHDSRRPSSGDSVRATGRRRPVSLDKRLRHHACCPPARSPISACAE